MANNRYIITHEDNTPQGGTGRVQYWIADTDTLKPVTGLNVGDLCWAVDTGFLYVATSSTAWSKVTAEHLSIVTLKELTLYNDSTESFLQFLTQSLVTSELRGSDVYDVFVRLGGMSGNLVSVGEKSGSPGSGYASRANYINQVAALASVNLANATPAGFYRISYYLHCTVADVAAGTITASFTYTDNVGSNTNTTAAIVLTATTSRQSGNFEVYLASGNITLLTTLTGIIGTSKYQIRARCEFLG